jgi:hypothetical protein
MKRGGISGEGSARRTGDGISVMGLLARCRDGFDPFISAHSLTLAQKYQREVNDQNYYGNFATEYLRQK